MPAEQELAGLIVGWAEKKREQRNCWGGREGLLLASTLLSSQPNRVFLVASMGLWLNGIISAFWLNPRILSPGDKPIHEGILSEKPLSLFDLVQGEQRNSAGEWKTAECLIWGENAVDFLWKRNSRGRQGTAFRDAWQTRLFRVRWRLESASITKYVESESEKQTFTFFSVLELWQILFHLTCPVSFPVLLSDAHNWITQCSSLFPSSQLCLMVADV